MIIIITICSLLFTLQNLQFDFYIRKQSKNWVGTISGTLSHHTGIFFTSGLAELGEAGWWKLVNNDPPEVLFTQSKL